MACPPCPLPCRWDTPGRGCDSRAAECHLHFQARSRPANSVPKRGWPWPAAPCRSAAPRDPPGLPGVGACGSSSRPGSWHPHAWHQASKLSCHQRWRENAMQSGAGVWALAANIFISDSRCLRGRCGAGGIAGRCRWCVGVSGPFHLLTTLFTCRQASRTRGSGPHPCLHTDDAAQCHAPCRRRRCERGASAPHPAPSSLGWCASAAAGTGPACRAGHHVALNAFSLLAHDVTIMSSG